jgi:chromosome condensin MukBEF MukE localization factor
MALLSKTAKEKDLEKMYWRTAVQGIRIMQGFYLLRIRMD